MDGKKNDREKNIAWIYKEGKTFVSDQKISILAVLTLRSVWKGRGKENYMFLFETIHNCIRTLRKPDGAR